MVVKIDHLSLKDTAESGQCFRWKKLEDSKYGIVAYGHYLEISQDGDEFTLSCSEDEWNNIWSWYFDMDTDYYRIERLIKDSGDAHLIECYEKGCGIRILRQDLWEMIVSYLISQNNNITRISKTIDLVCERAGILAEGACDQYSFPKPNELDVALFEDRSLGLGYRDVYLREIYEWAVENPTWVNGLHKLSYDEARRELLLRKGIGPKVADCICLFGLHHVEAFPIDTHVKQLLLKYYPNGFDFQYFEGVSGIVQQYLFNYEIH